MKNTVYIKLYFNKDETRERVKGAMVGAKPGNSIKTFKYFEHFGDNYSKNKKFLGFLRFLEYEGDLSEISMKYLIPPEKNAETCACKTRKLRVPFLSFPNERKMLERLQIIAQACLKKFPDTLEADETLLKDPSLSYNVRNCIVYRLGEKKVSIKKDFVDLR